MRARGPEGARAAVLPPAGPLGSCVQTSPKSIFAAVPECNFTCFLSPDQRESILIRLWVLIVPQVEKETVCGVRPSSCGGPSPFYMLLSLSSE